MKRGPRPGAQRRRRTPTTPPSASTAAAPGDGITFPGPTIVLSDGASGEKLAHVDVTHVYVTPSSSTALNADSPRATPKGELPLPSP